MLHENASSIQMRLERDTFTRDFKGFVMSKDFIQNTK